MTEERPMMIGAATVFVVSDIASSIEYYRSALGFKVTFQYGEPTFCAVTKLLCICLPRTRPGSCPVTAAFACS
jgi:hypothetical protein